MNSRAISIPIPALAVAISVTVGLVVALVYLATHRPLIEVVVPFGEEGGKVPFSYGATPLLANADFFADTRRGLLERGVRFVEADLEAMKLRVYEKGTPVVEVPIVAKGKRGSWWETPAGLYKIETKEREHFSSIGRVFMPWSMQFQGNFFIHGIPTHSDGTEVASSFSGGCIRLATADAEKVFAEVVAGTPVIVFASADGTDSFSHTIKGPELSAERYLVADIGNNFVFLAKGSHEQVPMADLSKLLAGLVATEYINLDKEIQVITSMKASTSVPRLEVGKAYTAFQLLYPLLRESSNEALRSLASITGPSSFVRYMNQRAGSLGMVNTRSTELYGADADTHTTGEDLFLLAKYLYQNRSFVLGVTSGRAENGAYSPGEFRSIPVSSGLQSSRGLVGGVVSDGDFGKSSLVVFEVSFRGEQRPVAVILFDSADPAEDTARALNYIANQYR